MHPGARWALNVMSPPCFTVPGGVAEMLLLLHETATIASATEPRMSPLLLGPLTLQPPVVPPPRREQLMIRRNEPGQHGGTRGEPGHDSNALLEVGGPG